MGVVFLSLTNISCTPKRKSVTELIVGMQKNTINIQYDKMVRWEDGSNETSVIEKDAKYKLVVYISRDVCSPCTLRGMENWNDWLSLEQDGIVEFIFLFSINKMIIDDVRDAYYESELKHSVFIDTCNVFRDNNLSIPNEVQYHTFLMDGCRRKAVHVYSIVSNIY